MPSTPQPNRHDGTSDRLFKRIFSCDDFVLPLPDGHRFPMEKYALLRAALVGIVPDHWVGPPPAVSDAQLSFSHTQQYVSDVVTGRLSARAQRRVGFPWSVALVERERRSVGGTLAACRSALRCGVGVNLAGGTHHAHASAGGGYCVFNDAAVAIRVLQHEGVIETATVIDCDVHQGDGTATIFADDDTVFTLSIHGADNYPFRKPPSDLDVPLPRHTEDRAYLDALQQALHTASARLKPDVVVYQSGVDPWEGDRLGTLSLTEAGLTARDQLVLSWCARQGIAVAVTMGGGYAPDVQDIVRLHRNTVLTAVDHMQ